MRSTGSVERVECDEQLEEPELDPVEYKGSDDGDVSVCIDQVESIVA